MPDRHAPTSGVGHRRSLTCLMEVRLVSVIFSKWLPTCHAMSYEVGRCLSGRRRRGIGSSGAGCQTECPDDTGGGTVGSHGPRCGFGHQPGPAGSLTCVHPRPRCLSRLYGCVPSSGGPCNGKNGKLSSAILIIPRVPCTSELVPLLVSAW